MPNNRRKDTKFFISTNLTNLNLNSTLTLKLILSSFYFAFVHLLKTKYGRIIFHREFSTFAAQILEMDNRDNLLGVIATLFRWKNQILKVVLSAVLGTAAISFIFLYNYYKSTTTFYVASPDVFKPEQMFGLSTKDMQFIGSDEDVDRILTIGQSGELYEYLIKKFDLYKHYDIDSTKEKAPYNVREAFEKLYTIKKTKEGAIELSIEDTDRKLAAEITNAAREKIDEFAQGIMRQGQLNIIKAFESSFTQKEKTMAAIADTLAKARQNYGVIDPDKQTAAVTLSSVEAKSNFTRNNAKLQALKQLEGVSKDTINLLFATVKGYEEELKSSTEMMKKYNDGYNNVSMLKDYYEQERNQIGRDKQRYQQLLTAYNTKISALSIIELGKVPIVKSRPMRSVIILSAGLVALIFSVIGVLLADNYKDVDWSEITNSQNGASSEKPKSKIGFMKRDN